MVKRKNIITVCIVVMILGLLVFSKVRSDRLYEEMAKSTTSYYKTHEECVDLEIDVENYLAELDLYWDTLVSVDVRSGFINTETGLSEKTKISIFIDDALVEDYTEATKLYDGYYAALALYFGESEIKEYDFYFYVADKYTFKNGSLIEE